jgi:hypothetical protein
MTKWCFYYFDHVRVIYAFQSIEKMWACEQGFLPFQEQKAYG